MAPDPAAAPQRRRIAIFASTAQDLEHECASLVASCLAAGSVVLCVAPGLPHGHATDGALAGATLADLPVNPQAVKPMAGGYTRSTISKLLDDWSPDVVLSYGSECLDAWSSTYRRRRDVLAACFLDDEEAAERPAASWFVSWPLPARLRTSCDLVLTSNQACAEALEKAWQRRKAPEVKVMPFRGVDVTALAECRLPPLNEGLTVLLFDDGTDPAFVAAYQTAATQITARSDNTAFVVAREADPDQSDAEPRTVDDRPVALRSYQPGGEDDLIANAHIVIQPGAITPYPMPFLTALAAGRPVIARDTPAMREAIDEVVNGILVREPTVEAISDAAEGLLRRPDLLASMARASRAKAERRFDAAVVNKGIRAALGLN